MYLLSRGYLLGHFGAPASYHMTELIYLKNPTLFQTKAKVLFTNTTGVRGTIVLDKTVFYPQGGGQPSDVGIIKNNDSSRILHVTMVKNVNGSGTIEHEGTWEGPALEVDEQVLVEINVDRRHLHSRIHSAGHLLDHAAEALNLPIVGEKGYHFPAGPYVEYRITDDQFNTSPEALTKLKQQWESIAEKMITEERSIIINQVSPDQLPESVLSKLSEKVRSLDSIRLVYFEGSAIPGPCGGTHATNTRELKGFYIKKISIKNNLMRVCYQQS